MDSIDDEAPIYGDVLESILMHVPLIDLVPASHVSKSWSHAVTSSLCTFNKPKPWLIVHTQCTRSPYNISINAYDPRSNVWMEVSHPSINYVSALRSSHSNLLYMLSPSKLSFSHDALHATWQHVDAPSVWRTDPVVAHVGNYIVIAGGTCDFEDDPLAVEVYDHETRTWDTCDSMPTSLNDAASSTWLTTATSANKLIVTEKFTALTHTFDPTTKKWAGPYDIKPDPKITHSIIGSSNNQLFLIGIIGEGEEDEKVKVKVKIYSVNARNSNFDLSEIGEMPLEMISKLKSETFGISSIGVCFAGDLAYFYKSSSEISPEIVCCEFEHGGGLRWWNVENAAAYGGEWRRSERVVYTCAEIGLGDLERAMSLDKREFTVKL